MQELIKDFLRKKRFAVVGSFRNEEKYAYKIFRNLINKGYEVFPINPRMNEVDGKICYKNVIDIPFEVEVANLVTPPLTTESVVKDCLQKGIRKVWMQPGAESQAAIKFCNDNNIELIYGMCVMLETLK
jgi:hypothetical protein